MLKKIFLLGISLSLVLAACSAIPTQEPDLPDAGIQTQVAFGVQQTLDANQQKTQVWETQASETQEALATQNTPVPTNTPQPTNTDIPTFTPAPTATVTKTPSPTATSTPAICNWASFVKDMAVADGAKFAGGSRFTKVWRLKNIGSCTWTKNYELVFESGKPMGGSSINLPKKVAPGETIDIALPLKAPADKGTYKGNWMLKDADGKKFGIGSSANSPIWVQIQVSDKAPAFSYDFATNFWAAEWKTDSAILYPSGTGYPNYVIYTDSFQLETGKWEDESAVIVNISKGERVRGIYPGYEIKSGDHFVAEIGCLQGSQNCKVKMILAYKIDGIGDRVQLGEWVETNDGKTIKINIDLSTLDGKTLVFILDMEAKSDQTTNQVFWFVPSIRNKP